MTAERLADLFRLAGVCQLAVLVASALVPFRLRWSAELRVLPRLHRQMYWVYGGYVVLSIVAFGLISLLHARELAAGGGLARAFCAYVAVFWAIRVGLQAVFEVREHLTVWWLRAGYHALTVVFAALAALYGGTAVFGGAAGAAAGLDI